MNGCISYDFFMHEKFIHAFNCVPAISYQIITKLWWQFKNWQYAWEKSDVATLANAKISENFIAEFLKLRKNFDVENEFAKLWESDIVAIGHTHPEFPFLLKQILDAPFLIYRKGAPLTNNQLHIAMVGTRRSTLYGEKIAYELAKALSKQGAIIVSGLALGIDAVSHFGAVSEQKPTVAVLGSGLHNITPSANHQLAANILKYNGTIISEQPPHSPAFPVNFIQRNRIISGLSSATIVIEAPIKSGALITAHCALEQNRDLYALPGDIHRDQAQGCNKLIAAGAYPIISIDDTLQKLGLNPETKKSLILTIQEKSLMEAINTKPSSSDALTKQTAIPSHKLNVLLSTLELKGAIKKNQAMLWEAI